MEKRLFQSFAALLLLAIILLLVLSTPASFAEGQDSAQDVPLSAGWNMISSYVAPNVPELATLLADIEGDMVLMKNGYGGVYWPALELDSIGSWDIRDGYQIFMNNPNTLSITGTAVLLSATPIDLESGWSLVSFPSSAPLPIADALDSISDKLILAKNGAGSVYWTAYGVNQIGALQPGEAYQLYLSSPGTLLYPAEISLTYNITTSANDESCDTGYGGYLNLEELGISVTARVPGGDNFAVGPFFTSFGSIDFYGRQYQGMWITDDGFIIFDPAQYGTSPWEPQFIPQADGPNGLAAMLWQNLQIVYDSDANHGVSLAASPDGSIMVVEFDDVHLANSAGDSYDVEMVMRRTVDNAPGAYEIVYAYDNLNGTLAGPLTIGIENDAGDGAAALVNQASAEGVISDGFMVCFDAVQAGANPAENNNKGTAGDDVPSADMLRNAAVNMLPDVAKQ